MSETTRIRLFYSTFCSFIASLVIERIVERTHHDRPNYVGIYVCATYSTHLKLPPTLSHFKDMLF